MTDFLPLTSLIAMGRPADKVMARQSDGTYVKWGNFANQMQTISHIICSNTKADNILLACEDIYNFIIGFFATARLGKNIIISPNLQSETLRYMQSETNAFQINDEFINLRLSENNILNISDNTNHTRITLYTSGSTGKPKIISKPIQALEDEVAMLHNHWGDRIKNGLFLSSVTHYHAYGLPFHILWALCSGQTLGLERISYPETLFHYLKTDKVNFISSPVFLQQLSQLPPDDKNYHYLQFISAAGAPLDQTTARTLASYFPYPVTEIYGSTETGAAATKTVANDDKWHCLQNVTILSDNHMTFVRSPYSGQTGPVAMADTIQQHEDGSFRLLGREDRIVKVFEKRVSLDQMERVCKKADVIKEVKIIQPELSQRLACVVSLTEYGKTMLNSQGKRALVNHIKGYLRPEFDLVVFPRKWRFIDDLPRNDLGKIQHHLLNALFSEQE